MKTNEITEFIESLEIPNPSNSTKLIIDNLLITDISYDNSIKDINLGELVFKNTNPKITKPINKMSVIDIKNLRNKNLF